MGLCPSRNQATRPNPKFEQKIYTPAPDPSPTATGQFQLRADAAAFVPKQHKEPWEKFLDQKQLQSLGAKAQSFARKHDGTYTSDYRKLLTKDTTKERYVPPHQRDGNTGGSCDDLLKEWREVAKRPAAQKPVAAKPKKQKLRVSDVDQKLKEAMQKVKQLPKEQVLEQLATLEQKHPKDDIEAQRQLVPFGLTDSHYFSDGNDASKGFQHCSKIKTKTRAYARSQPITPHLEAAMTDVLHELRILRSSEVAADLDLPRRYCVGVREVARTLKDKQNCPLKAVIVAPDVEEERVTTKGNLDERLNDLIREAKAMKIPVIYGLSRTRIGQAIKKNVTISVLGVLNVRGMQEPFDAMLRAQGKA